MTSDSDLSVQVADIDRRFQPTWPSSVSSMISHLRQELHEIEQAIDEADGRPHMNKHVVEECGDAMLLLGRLAIMHGAASALEPLIIAIRKTSRRLDHYERLVKSMTVADAWRAAKECASRG